MSAARIPMPYYPLADLRLVISKRLTQYRCMAMDEALEAEPDQRALDRYSTAVDVLRAVILDLDTAEGRT